VYKLRELLKSDRNQSDDIEYRLQSLAEEFVGSSTQTTTVAGSSDYLQGLISKVSSLQAAVDAALIQAPISQPSYQTSDDTYIFSHNVAIGYDVKSLYCVTEIQARYVDALVTGNWRSQGEWSLFSDTVGLTTVKGLGTQGFDGAFWAKKRTTSILSYQEWVPTQVSAPLDAYTLGVSEAQYDALTTRIDIYGYLGGAYAGSLGNTSLVMNPVSDVTPEPFWAIGNQESEIRVVDPSVASFVAQQSVWNQILGLLSMGLSKLEALPGVGQLVAGVSVGALTFGMDMASRRFRDSVPDLNVWKDGELPPPTIAQSSAGLTYGHTVAINSGGFNVSPWGFDPHFVPDVDVGSASVSSPFTIPGFLLWQFRTVTTVYEGTVPWEHSKLGAAFPNGVTYQGNFAVDKNTQVVQGQSKVTVTWQGVALAGYVVGMKKAATGWLSKADLMDG
jgi:hypothetical protein